MSTLKDSIVAAMKVALKSKQQAKLSTIRMILAAVKQKEVDARKELTDSDILAILDKEMKQRKDSIAKYQEGNREDLAKKEQVEIDVIKEFLPAALSQNEITDLIKAAIDSSGAKEIKDMGQVMNQLKPKVQGRADMGAVSKLVKELLN